MYRNKIITALHDFLDKAAKRFLVSEDFADLCKSINVCKMYYDIPFGSEKYKDPYTQKLMIAGDVQDGKMILYCDKDAKPGIKFEFPFYHENTRYVRAYIEFYDWVKKEDIPLKLCRFFANQIYLTVSRQNTQIMLDYTKNHDIDTFIPNINFMRRFCAAIAKKAIAGEYAVIFANVRDFKQINKRFGIQAGDEAMVKYAQTIVNYAEEDECICRVGGDNYVMLIKKKNLGSCIEKLQNVKISGILSAPDKVLNIAAWIGISMIENGSMSIQPHIGHASVACSICKQQLNKNVVYYNAELAAMIDRSREIAAMFLPAVENHEFIPFFQPKVNMVTGELIGIEALCRWKHNGSFIYPDQFIPVLDQQGLMHTLDMTILDETCKAMRKWLDMGLELPRVSFNVSRKNLFVPDIEQKILDIIHKNRLSADMLEIEITETSKENEINRLISFLSTLKQNGISIAIDDFGTGYSSLSLIQNINADILKIDKSFISSLDSNDRSSVLVETIIHIADKLNMDVIAEGVETADEGCALINMGCINAQGYYYSRPVDFDAVTRIIQNKGFEPIKK